jgi:hypothetical protein
VGYEPHGWSERQYISDTSTHRVRKHREKRNVSVTPPDTETDTEYTVSKDTGADAPPDPDKVFWANAIGYLGERRRSVVGKWISLHGREATGTAIAQAQMNNAMEPVAYINKVLTKAKQADWEFTGPC